MSEWVRQYAGSHEHPVNRVLHTVGIPLIVASLAVAAASPWLAGLWPWAAGLFVAGWVLQFIGHAVRGQAARVLPRLAVPAGRRALVDRQGAGPGVTAAPRLALALVLAAYLLPLAVPVPLMEDDEGLHAAIALEMVERGDWTVPRLLTEPFLDKPILYFWLQAASIAALGPSEFSVRLPGTLMALAGVGRHRMARRDRSSAPPPACGPRSVYATMLLPYAVSLAPLHDLVMVPLVVVALGAFWRAATAASARRSRGWTLVAAWRWGCRCWGRASPGVGLVGVGMAAWLLWTRALSWRLAAAGAAAVARRRRPSPGPGMRRWNAPRPATCTTSSWSGTWPA